MIGGKVKLEETMAEESSDHGIFNSVVLDLGEGLHADQSFIHHECFTFVLSLGALTPNGDPPVVIFNTLKKDGAPIATSLYAGETVIIPGKLGWSLRKAEMNHAYGVIIFTFDPHAKGHFGLKIASTALDGAKLVQMFERKVATLNLTEHDSVAELQKCFDNTLSLFAQKEAPSESTPPDRSEAKLSNKQLVAFTSKLFSAPDSLECQEPDQKFSLRRGELIRKKTLNLSPVKHTTIRKGSTSPSCKKNLFTHDLAAILEESQEDETEAREKRKRDKVSPVKKPAEPTLVNLEDDEEEELTSSQKDGVKDPPVTNPHPTTSKRNKRQIPVHFNVIPNLEKSLKRVKSSEFECVPAFIASIWMTMDRVLGHLVRKQRSLEEDPFLGSLKVSSKEITKPQQIVRAAQVAVDNGWISHYTQDAVAEDNVKQFRFDIPEERLIRIDERAHETSQRLFQEEQERGGEPLNILNRLLKPLFAIRRRLDKPLKELKKTAKKRTKAAAKVEEELEKIKRPAEEGSTCDKFDQYIQDAQIYFRVYTLLNEREVLFKDLSKRVAQTSVFYHLGEVLHKFECLFEREKPAELGLIRKKDDIVQAADLAVAVLDIPFLKSRTQFRFVVNYYKALTNAPELAFFLPNLDIFAHNTKIVEAYAENKEARTILISKYISLDWLTYVQLRDLVFKPQAPEIISTAEDALRVIQDETLHMDDLYPKIPSIFCTFPVLLEFFPHLDVKRRETIKKMIKKHDAEFGGVGAKKSVEEGERVLDRMRDQMVTIMLHKGKYAKVSPLDTRIPSPEVQEFLIELHLQEDKINQEAKMEEARATQKVAYTLQEALASERLKKRGQDEEDNEWSESSASEEGETSDHDASPHKRRREY